MKKLIYGALTLGALAAGTNAFAQAREFDPTPYGFSLRIGAAILQDDDSMGDNDLWTAIGIDYNIQSSILRSGDSFLSVDYINSGFGTGGDAVIPVILGNRFYSTQGEDMNRFYFMLGAGAIVTTFSGTDTSFGAMLGAGFEAGPNIFFEGRYSFSGKHDGVNPNAIGLYLGYRF